MSTPSTTIHICSGVLLNNNYDHTITFPSRAAQVAYFQTKVVKTFTGYAYLRKRWSIKVAASMGDARKWSYLFFMNPDPHLPNQRWAYYFITDVEYINDNTVELFLEMDVMQTYLDDYTLQDCFVEREHSETDAFGENTIEEGLDTGELIPVSISHTTALDRLCILIMSTIDLYSFFHENKEVRVLGSMKDGVFCGMGIYAVDSSRHARLQSLISKLDDEGKTDAIVNMWMYPRSLITLESGDSWDTANVHVHRVAGYTAQGGTAFNRPEKMAGGYTPVNAKLKQYPYSLLYVTNNHGGAGIYRYEWWHDGSFPYDCGFVIEGSLGADAAVKLSPAGYHHYEDSAAHDDGIVMSGYPTCGWNSDTYKLWLAQNQSQHNLAMVNAGLTIAAGVGTAIAGGAVAVGTGGAGALVGGGAVTGGVTMVASGLTQVAQLNAQKRDYDVQPPSSRGAQSSNINVANGTQHFSFIHKSVDKFHARRIDDYFTMYGYKTCRVKTPNVDSRPHFNYVKTVGSNVKPKFGICHADLSKINAVFDRGITFWKNGDEIGDYSVDNRPT